MPDYRAYRLLSSASAYDHGAEDEDYHDNSFLSFALCCHGLGKLAQRFAMALTLLPLGMLIANSTAMTMTAATAMTRALHRDDDGHHDDKDQGPLGR